MAHEIEIGIAQSFFELGLLPRGSYVFLIGVCYVLWGPRLQYTTTKGIDKELGGRAQSLEIQIPES